MNSFNLETDPSDDSEFAAMVSSFCDQAALLGTFDPFRLLKNVLFESGNDALEARLLNTVAPSIEEVMIGETLCWQLRPEARRKVLASLAARGEIRSTLRDARPDKTDRFGAILQTTLKTGKLLGEAASSSDLQLQAIALDFVRDLPSGRIAQQNEVVDPRILMARRAERTRLDHVAPRLFGRESECKALDLYVRQGEFTRPIEVFRSSALDSGVGAKRLRPLLVTGIGGSGKSAIIADLTRRTQRDDWSGPIVLSLDFDQRNVAMGVEREWLNELSRQIGVARPNLDRAMSAVRGEARRRLNTKSPGGSESLSGNATLNIVDAMRNDLARALEDGGAANTDLVVVVDTFEEVLVRSDMTSRALAFEPFGLVLDFLDSLSRLRSSNGPIFGSVRAIVAGRVKPLADQPHLLAKWFEAHLEIGELDVDAAAAFLRERGDRRVFNFDRSRQFANLVPRFPLILKILVDFARNRNAREIDMLVQDGVLSAPFSAEAAIRVLYSRFLDRLIDHEIRDPATGETRFVEKADLMKLAHPGLALPMVNARLIREVLAQPSGLGEISMQRAVDLLAALSREVWLVERTGADGVRHVPVLRRIMLPMLLGDAGDANPELQTAVRAVHRAAADWYGAGGAGEASADAPAHAAYHHAFLGEVDALHDPALSRQVLELAGEDIFAMPIAARALLRREQKSDAALSEAETAALPDDVRELATATRGVHRAIAGVTSRQSEKAYRATGQQVSVDDPRISSRRSSIAVGAANGDTDANFAAISPNGHTRQTLSTRLSDRFTADAIQVAFAEADFARVVELGAPTMDTIRRAGLIDPPFDKLYEPTGHWTWKWALSCLATGAFDDGFFRWASHAARPESDDPDIIRLSVITGLALATVALGRPPYFMDEDVYRTQALVSLQALRHRSEVESLSTLRMLSLAGYLAPHELSRTAMPLLISPKLVRLAALWPAMHRHGLPDIVGPGRLVSKPERIASRLSNFAEYSIRNSELFVLDDADPIRLFPEAQFSEFPSGLLPQELLPAYGQLVRGRTPELYDPVRAALADIADDEPFLFADTIEYISELAPFWPTDLTDQALTSRLLIRRESDYVLAGLVSFLDLSGLTVEFMRRLSHRVRTGPRFEQVMYLCIAYDRLLLTPFDAVDYLPSTIKTR